MHVAHAAAEAEEAAAQGAAEAAAKEINYANPTLPSYLYKRYTEVLKESSKDDPIIFDNSTD